MIINTIVKQGSSEWFQLHCGIPSGSEMDRIITPGGKLCTAQRSIGYRNRKLAEWASGEVIIDQEYESVNMMNGKMNEPFAAKAFTLQTGYKVAEVGFITRDDGLVGVSPDRLVLGGIETAGVLEIKCPTEATHIGYLLEQGSLLAEYKVQVYAEAWIAGTADAWIMSYHPKWPALIIPVLLDVQFANKMTDAVNAWVDDMVEKRAELEQRFGLFVRKTQETEENPFGVTMQDAERIIAGWEK